MVTITSPSQVVSAVRAASALMLNADLVAQLFNQFGDARSTAFSRQFIKDNAQVLLDCNSTQKWYMRYATATTNATDVLFLAVTNKNKVSKGKINPSTRSLSDNEQIEEIETAENVLA